jgi:hypothetical protein
VLDQAFAFRRRKRLLDKRRQQIGAGMRCLARQFSPQSANYDLRDFDLGDFCHFFFVSFCFFGAAPFSIFAVNRGFN